LLLDDPIPSRVKRASRSSWLAIVILLKDEL
jgi:hypothetical protein